MTNMIEPLGTSGLQNFFLTGVTTFNVNNIESPFIVHWLEWQADRMAASPYLSEKGWTNIVRLLEAATSVASIWSATSGGEREQRLQRKLEHARKMRGEAAKTIGAVLGAAGTLTG